MEVLKNGKKAEREIRRAVAHGDIINYILCQHGNMKLKYTNKT